jgi:hypothetical protein
MSLTKAYARRVLPSLAIWLAAAAPDALPFFFSGGAFSFMRSKLLLDQDDLKATDFGAAAGEFVALRQRLAVLG